MTTRNSGEPGGVSPRKFGLSLNGPGAYAARLTRCCGAGCVVLVCVMFSSAADWPQFRGSDGSGFSAETGLPETWSESEHLIWKSELPGRGASSPITVGGKIYVTCFSGEPSDGMTEGTSPLVRHLVCLDEQSGKQLWKSDVKSTVTEALYAGFLMEHGYTSSTPVSDGERVYAFFGAEGVVAFDTSGAQLWKTSVGTETDTWGSGTSPLVFENLVIVNACIESSEVVALDKLTGAVKWKVPVARRSWNTPALVPTEAGALELVINNPHKVLGLDPKTGTELWHCDGIPDAYTCPSVVVGKGVAYLVGGRKSRFIAVRTGGKGDVTQTHVLWKQDAGANVSTPALVGKHLFGIGEGGIAYCLDTADGKILFKERLSGDGAAAPMNIARRLRGSSRSQYASPIAADGKLFTVTRHSGTYVLATGTEPKFKILSRNVIVSDTSSFNATPAVSRGRLLLRSEAALYSIGKQ